MGWIIDSRHLDETLNILSNYSFLNWSTFSVLYIGYKIVLKLLDKNFQYITHKISIIYEGNSKHD